MSGDPRPRPPLTRQERIRVAELCALPLSMLISLMFDLPGWARLGLLMVAVLLLMDSQMRTPDAQRHPMARGKKWRWQK